MGLIIGMMGGKTLDPKPSKDHLGEDPGKKGFEHGCPVCLRLLLSVSFIWPLPTALHAKQLDHKALQISQSKKAQSWTLEIG